MSHPRTDSRGGPPRACGRTTAHDSRSVPMEDCRAMRHSISATLATSIRGVPCLAVRPPSPKRRPSGLLASLLPSLLLGAAMVGCGDAGEPYQPMVPPAGVKASLPSVPSVPNRPIKEGEAYTVWGASYHLRSRVHHNDVAGRD